MGIRMTPSGGAWITGTTSNYQVPFSNSENAFVARGSGISEARLITGRLEGSVFIENPQVLDDIARGAGLTVQYLQRDAAKAALALYDTAEELLADEVKGKLHITVAPYGGEGDYLVTAQVNTEPSVRRTASNATIRVDKSGRVLKNKRYIHAREVPSITRYVAVKMHLAFQVAREKVQTHSTMAVQGQILSAFEQFGVKVDTRGVAHAPSGGIEFGGSYYKGGQVLPKSI